jgi:hypothetical protein
VTPELLDALRPLTIELQPAGEPTGRLAGHADELAGMTPAHAAVAEQVVATALELTLDDEELLPAIAERTLASGARLYALTPRRMSLEQIFLEVVGAEDSGQ